MLVFASVVPHPPLLIPAIGKDAVKKVEKTKQALEKLEEELYLSKPDTILIVGPHGDYFDGAFCLNVSTDYVTDLREFGDLTTKQKFKGELNLASKIKMAAENQNIPISMVTEPAIDHSISVPLFYLTKHLPNVGILPINYSGLDRKTHLDFGYVVKEQIMNSNNRIAVVASGDLSHALTSDAPAGFNAAGAEFDAKIQELLAHHNTAGLLQLDEKMVEGAAECGFRSLLILFGILRDVNYDFKHLSYEAPFGVGYLTANFAL